MVCGYMGRRVNTLAIFTLPPTDPRPSRYPPAIFGVQTPLDPRPSRCPLPFSLSEHFWGAPRDNTGVFAEDLAENVLFRPYNRRPEGSGGPKKRWTSDGEDARWAKFTFAFSNPLNRAPPDFSLVSISFRGRRMLTEVCFARLSSDNT